MERQPRPKGATTPRPLDSLAPNPSFRTVVLVVCTLCLHAGAARAAERNVWLLPTVVERPGREATVPPAPPVAKEPLEAVPAPGGAAPPAGSTTVGELEPIARELDVLLGEAVRDFGLEPMPGGPGLDRTEEGLVKLAQDAWVVSASLRPEGERIALRLVVVPHHSQVMQVRVQALAEEEIEVRTLAMLREVLAPIVTLPTEPRVADCAKAPSPPEAHVRSEGRAVLALHAAALGAFLGFSLQRAAGSDDARVTYPLAALGAGVGLGMSMVVAEEWDITVGRAWYLSAGMFWPGAAGVLLASSYDVQPESNQLLYGVLAATGGVTLATAALSVGEVNGDGAVLTHSGAALGMLLGGLIDMTIKGNADFKPERGMGIGALVGVLTTGAVASQVQVPEASDLLFIDLSALLGGLAGAALGTPLLVQERSATRDRLWLSTVITGTLVGTGLGFWATDATFGPRPATQEAELQVRPTLGAVGEGGFGIGLEGAW
jgi:hypothetical protein